MEDHRVQLIVALPGIHAQRLPDALAEAMGDARRFVNVPVQ
jgi:hypothetical protein